MFQDLRFSLRMFRRNPGFAAVAIFTLALGIGATIVIFSLADSLIYHAFPYRDAQRITLSFIHELRPGGYSGATEFSDASFADYVRGSHAMEEVIGYRHTGFAYRNAEGTQQIPGMLMTPNTLAFLGVSPLYGRAASGSNECVVSYAFWREQLHADPQAAGTTILLDDTPVTVAGIMPPRFQFLGGSIWIPKVSGFVQAMGRLRPGVTLAAATIEFDGIERRLAEAYPRQYPNKRFRVSLETLPENAVGSFRSVLYILFAAVTLLLLIACSNVANLLLARATARERELAIRAAVGASRGRLVRQLLAESLMLALAAGFAGCVLAQAGVAALRRMVPASAVPGEAEIALQPLALGFACAVTLAVTLLCGLAPAIHSTRLQGSGPGQSRFRSALAIAEVALSFVLLVGAGLMTRTLFSLTHIDLGFHTANLLHARMTLPAGRYQTAGEQRAFLRQIVSHVERVPGVVSATFSLEDTAISGGVDVDFDEGTAALGVCDETYFATMGRSLVRGAAFTAADIDAARPIAIVNRAFVRAYLPHQEPIGHQVHFHMEHWRGAPDNPTVAITGVVSDTRNHGLRDGVRPQIYVPYSSFAVPPVGIMVRTRTAPLALVAGIRRQVWAVDPGVALTGAGTVEASIGENYYAEPRFGLAALGAFAAIGLALVLVGVFSVMAYTVSTRTREIGIRMALGAQPSQILATTLRKGMALRATGAAIGFGASVALSRLSDSQLWGVTPNDPSTFLAVAATVMPAGALACLIPARRAARVDPATALKQ